MYKTRNWPLFGVLVEVHFRILHAILQTRSNELIDSLEVCCMKLVNARSSLKR